MPVVGLAQLSHLLDGYPGFIPGLVVAIFATVILHGWLARRLRIGRWLSIALCLSLGIIVAATLFPDVSGWVAGADGPAGRAWSCDLSRPRPSPGELIEGGEATANVLLFIPLGVAVALLPRAIRPVSILLALVLPFAIEFVQAALPTLVRRCQAEDVADNLLGLVIGLLAGAILKWWSARRVDARPHGSGG